MKEYPITPVPAPRQVRSDLWRPRDCVLRYRAFKDECRAYAVDMPVPSKVTFFLQMPESWSKKRKALLIGKPHCQKPDVDNLTKALLDALFKEDGHVWSIWAEKRWAETSSIRVEAI